MREITTAVTKSVEQGDKAAYNMKDQVNAISADVLPHKGWGFDC